MDGWRRRRFVDIRSFCDPKHVLRAPGNVDQIRTNLSPSKLSHFCSGSFSSSSCSKLYFLSLDLVDWPRLDYLAPSEVSFHSSGNKITEVLIACVSFSSVGTARGQRIIRVVVMVVVTFF